MVRDTASVRITGIRLDRLVLPLDPPFPAAWDPVPRRAFGATIVRVETDEGVTGIGSGDTMDGFEAFEHLFLGQDPLAIARHVRVLETIDFHAGRYWPLEAALWDLRRQGRRPAGRDLVRGSAEGIPAYASCGSLLAPAARAESAVRLRGGRVHRPQDPDRSAAAGGRAGERRPPPVTPSAIRWRSWSTSTRAGGWPAIRHARSIRWPLARSPRVSPTKASCGSRSRWPERTCGAWPGCAPRRPASGSPAAR